MPRRARIAILVLLALQIYLPLHYYLFRHDKRDERFAWRMFSPTRIEKCATRFFLGDSPKPIRSSSVFHNAWIGIAQRGRQDVIEAMAQRLCDLNKGQEIHVRVLCEARPGVAARMPGALFDLKRRDSDDDIEVVSRGVFNFCSTGRL